MTSTFDALFQAHGDDRLFDAFAVTAVYVPPAGGEGVGVRLDVEETASEANGGEYGQISTTGTTGRVLASELDRPRQGGIFTATIRGVSRRLKIDAAPRADNGEWILDLVEVG
jgi:hypothetical protein